MALKELLKNRFDYGISEQERDLANGYAGYVENLDLKVRSATQVANNVITIDDRNIRALLDIGGTIYGLGWDASSSQKTSVWYDLAGTPAYSTPAANYTFTGKANPFFLTDGTYIYYDNIGHIGRFTIQSHAQSGDWATLSGGLTGGLWWQGNMYGWNGQDIYKVTTGAAITDMLTIPADQTIVKLIDYGNLMAIICTSSTGQSNMYLWDGVTTTTFYDIIKIGLGTVIGADILDGVITLVIQLKNYKGIRVKKYVGNVFTTSLTYYGRKNLAGDQFVAGASQVKAYTNYIYFITYATRPNSANSYEYAVMRYGREDINKQFNLSVYKTLEIATGIASLAYNDFVIIEDTAPSSTIPLIAVYASILTNTNVSTSSHNLKTAVYTSQPGVFQTGIITGGDSSIDKELKEMSVQFAPLLSGQSIVLKYRCNAETTFTTIVTINTIGLISYEPALESDGSQLKTSKEVEFRIEGLGGAKITGFSFRYEPQLGQR